MKVDIWSDVRCPFCYIGKHKFEKALARFPQKEKIEVEWHSFELDPSVRTNPDKSVVAHLAEAKGISEKEAEKMVEYSSKIAQKAGLSFNHQKTVVANSFNAHRLIQLAKTEGLASEVEELLFKAYFEEAQNIDNTEVLFRIGKKAGLEEGKLTSVLSSDIFAKEVREDESSAQQMGISGVPFFVLDEKYAVSGAQEPEVFLDALSQVWKEHEKTNELIVLDKGNSCSVDGTNCD